MFILQMKKFNPIEIKRFFSYFINKDQQLGLEHGHSESNSSWVYMCLHTSGHTVQSALKWVSSSVTIQLNVYS